MLVSVNHRLNIFGYLYLDQLDSRYEGSGMAGLLDLVLALEWVRQNIASFGGDPENVTIMGESGGGMKVSSLLAMPPARKLFRRAVVESGSRAGLCGGSPKGCGNCPQGIGEAWRGGRPSGGAFDAARGKDSGGFPNGNGAGIGI